MAKAKKTIPDQIRELKAKSGKTNYRIAQETGINESTLGRMEAETWGQDVFGTAGKLLDSLGHQLTITKKK